MFNRIKLREQVRESMRNAVEENGYTDLLNQPVEDVASDMLNCDSTYEGYDPDEEGFLAEMMGSIEEWIQEYQSKEDAKIW
jgi:hypothetical protein